MTSTHQTLRVRNIPSGTTREKFETELKDLVAEPRKAWFLSPLNSQVLSIFKTSLATHIEGASMDGTVTFLDKDQKDRALRATHESWEFDDRFDGVTVLHSPSSAEVDICAVHGMNGNAFETWARGSNMWLRDFLPTSEYKNARIMTFGYNSQLLDRRTEMGIKQWAIFLLQQVSSVRKGLKDRPVIFIAYSLGGLVVREAMVRLNEHPAETPNMVLQRCGQLFLGTPHSGTTEADWNDFIVTFSEILFGLRREAIINNFRSFNTNSVDNKERFNMINPRLSFRCLCETKMMKAKGKNRLVVSSDSAGLLGVTATPMYDVDHRMMCKFSSRHDLNFNLVINELSLVQQNIKDDLLPNIRMSDETLQSKNYVRAVSEPPQNAPLYPVGACYEGLPIPFQEQSRLVGRDEEISIVREYLKNQQNLSAVTVAITGIGGIGKTELLYEIARLNHDRRKVFYFSATDQKSLRKAYEEVALHIGPEILAKRSIAPRDFVSDWQMMDSYQKTSEFRMWLEEETNQDSLIILDDLDGLGNGESIHEAFPRNSRLVVYSSRNPHLERPGPRVQPRISLSSLSEEETVKIIRSECVAHGDQEFGDLSDPQILRRIANRVQGHPLIALQAVKYMREVLSIRSRFPGRTFLEICNSHDNIRFKRFLMYKPSGGGSILETFQTSRYRLEQNGSNNAWNLMLLISHLQTSSSIVDFRDFFFLRSNVKDLPQLEGADISGLNDEEEVLTALSDLEKVSFGTRQGITSTLEFHPFWLECGRQLISKERREEYLRYILVTCFRCIEHARQNQDEQLENSFLPHVYHYFEISDSFDVPLQALTLPTEIDVWIQQLREIRVALTSSSHQLKGKEKIVA